MDFLNKAFTQLNDLFRSMTPGGRITAGLLLVVAVVSIGYLFQSQVSGGDEYLFGDTEIPPATLHRMEEALGKAGQNGYTIEPGRIKVRHADRAACLAALADAGALPPHPLDYLKESTTSNYFDDPAQRKRKHDQALMEELSLAIRQMKDIESATVYIDSQPQSGLGQTPLKTASVSASACGSAPLNDEQVEKICNFVAGAIAGMSPENVTIADANGPARIGSRRDAGLADDSYTKDVRRREQDINYNIRQALRDIPRVVVASSVILDHEKLSRTVEIKNDPKTVPVRVQETSKSSNRESNSPGGAPGLERQGGGVNLPGSLASAAGKSGSETSEESKNVQDNVVSTTSTEKESDGRAIRSAKVAIRIPASYYESVWRAKNPTKPGEEPKPPDQAALDKISEEITLNVRATAAALLPTLSDVKDPTANVTVTTFQDIKPPDAASPGMPQRAFSWLGANWPMAAMVVLVLMSIGMLRSALHGAPASGSAGHPSGGSVALSARIPGGEAKTEEKEEPVEATAARRLRRMTGSGPSLRDELSDLVREDPDSAASILRSWIGQVT